MRMGYSVAGGDIYKHDSTSYAFIMRIFIGVFE